MAPDEQWLKECADRWSAELAEQAGDGQLDLLRLLAAEPESGLREIAPGVWCVDRSGGWSAR